MFPEPVALSSWPWLAIDAWKVMVSPGPLTVGLPSEPMLPLANVWPPPVTLYGAGAAIATAASASARTAVTASTALPFMTESTPIESWYLDPRSRPLRASSSPKRDRSQKLVQRRPKRLVLCAAPSGALATVRGRDPARRPARARPRGLQRALRPAPDARAARGGR